MKSTSRGFRALLVLLFAWTALAVSGQTRAVAETWNATTPLPQGFSGHKLVHCSGYLYNLGGMGSELWVKDAHKVYFTPVTGPGTVGSWTETTALPAGIFWHAAVVSQGTIYVIGGYHYHPGLLISAKVYYSHINADGSLGVWQTATPLPKALYLHSAAVWEDTIYVTGGWGEDGLSDKVYAATIQPDASLGSWSELAATPLPEATFTHAMVQDGALYILGGVINHGTEMTDEVYYSLIQPDKTLEGWQATMPLVQPLGELEAVVVSGRIYVIGGSNGPMATADVWSAPILPDKTLGAWEGAPPLPVPIYSFGETVADGVIYVSGGLDGSAYQNGVYSLVLDLDTDGDGISDSSDNCPNDPNPEQTDTDGDEIGDVCDTCPFGADDDIDEDGICDDADNCPNDPNPEQTDTDGDEIGDECDLDDDNDQVDDVEDNCQYSWNPDQLDFDVDNVGDACDMDDDGDNVIDADDKCSFTLPGEVVNSDGCSIDQLDQLCPCDNEWKNHGAYVRCVAHTSNDFMADGLIEEWEKDAIVSNAAESDCGHKK